MKTLIILVMTSLSLSTSLYASQGSIWTLKSIEKQFAKSGEAVFKNHHTLTQDSGSAKPHSMSNTVVVRPESKSLNSPFWLYDAWVELYEDEDRDGYFSRFSVEFDADTDYSQAEVYARLYLGQNEEFREYHTSSTFSIFADSSEDSFVVESELLIGFAPSDYEVLIELYDAYSDELVAVLDGNSDADLYLVSLESNDYEQLHIDHQVVVVTEHGGSISWLAFLLFPLVLVRKLNKCRTLNKCRI